VYALQNMEMKKDVDYKKVLYILLENRNDMSSTATRSLLLVMNRMMRCDLYT